MWIGLAVVNLLWGQWSWKWNLFLASSSVCDLFFSRASLFLFSILCAILRPGPCLIIWFWLLPCSHGSHLEFSVLHYKSALRRWAEYMAPSAMSHFSFFQCVPINRWNTLSTENLAHVSVHNWRWMLSQQLFCRLVLRWLNKESTQKY